MHRRSRSSLLLAELVISIFFFLAAAAVSVRIFAAAREKSDEAVKNQNLAALVSNCGESFSAAEGDPEKTLSGLQTVYSGLAVQGQEGTLSLSDCLAADAGGSTTLSITFSETLKGTGTLHSMTLSVTSPDGTQAYSRVVEHFRTGKEGS